MWTQAGANVDTFQKNLANWFDDGMDRLNGIYTRWSRGFSLVFGLAIAVGYNVNSLEIATALLHATPEEAKYLADVGQGLTMSTSATPQEVAAAKTKLDAKADALTAAKAAPRQNRPC